MSDKYGAAETAGNPGIAFPVNHSKLIIDVGKIKMEGVRLMSDNVSLKTHEKYSRRGFAACSWIFALCVVIQVFIAGYAIFADPGYWNTHTSFVHIIEVFPVLMFILSLFGRVSGSLRWHSLGLIVLIVLQYVTANLDAVPAVNALHTVIALAMFWVSLSTALKSTSRSFFQAA